MIRNRTVSPVRVLFHKYVLSQARFAQTRNFTLADNIRQTEVAEEDLVKQLTQCINDKNAGAHRVILNMLNKKVSFLLKF
jgi:hypothetical protein